MGGLAKSMPMLGTLIVLFALANAGLPGTNGFVGEFLVLVGAFVQFPVLTLIATAGVVLAAAYLLWATQRTLFGPRADGAPVLRDLGRREAMVMLCFVVAIVGLGLAPAPSMRRMEASLAALVTRVQTAAVASPSASANDGMAP
jgi:NADH-quinone oxidoreductase subunit M